MMGRKMIGLEFEMASVTKKYTQRGLCTYLPVNCGIVRCLIGYFDYDSVIFLSIYRWPREHSIDGHDVLGVAQSSNSFGLYLKIESD